MGEGTPWPRHQKRNRFAGKMLSTTIFESVIEHPCFHRALGRYGLMGCRDRAHLVVGRGPVIVEHDYHLLPVRAVAHEEITGVATAHGAVALVARQRPAVPARKRAVIYFGWVFFLISSGSPHVRCTPVGRTRGEPDELGLTPMGVKLNGSGRVPLLRLVRQVVLGLRAKKSGNNFSGGYFP